MPQSLAQVLVHLIFSTTHRQPFLKSKETREAMNAYVVGILKNLGCPSLIVNCVDDHIHILFSLSRTVTIADVLEEVKKGTSGWVKTQDPACVDFYWQSGYGAFSVSPSVVPKLKRYIENQEEHHKHVSFQDEMREFFRKHGVEFDE